jgi:hypothetical protein
MHGHCNNMKFRNIFQLHWELHFIIFSTFDHFPQSASVVYSLFNYFCKTCLTIFCNHVKLNLAMWLSHHCFPELAASHWLQSIISGQYRMENIQLFDSCELPFHSVVVKCLCSVWFLICLNIVRGCESKCLHTSAVTSHVGVMEVTWQCAYRESECLLTSAVTRHVEVKGVSAVCLPVVNVDFWLTKFPWNISFSLRNRPLIALATSHTRWIAFIFIFSISFALYLVLLIPFILLHIWSIFDNRLNFHSPVTSLSSGKENRRYLAYLFSHGVA